MNRRTFFGLLAGAAAVLGIELVRREEPSYIYDWSSDPSFTNAPRVSGGPRYGGPPINRIWVDNREVSHLLIRSLRTGPDGYVVHKIADDGWRYEHLGGKEGEVFCETLRGRVRYEHDPVAYARQVEELSAAARNV